MDPKFLTTSTVFLPFACVGPKSAPTIFPSFAHAAVPKTGPKILSQQAPNTHLWLIPSHSGLLLCSLPCHNELLKSFLCGCDLLLCLCFLHQNPLCCLHGNGGLQFLCTCLALLASLCLVQLQVLLSPKRPPPVVAQASA
jgi:hypothetical protein